MPRIFGAIDRRTALQLLGGGTAVAATAAFTLADSAQAYDPGQTEMRIRYRETEHVRAFYRTNGYETLKQ